MTNIKRNLDQVNYRLTKLTNSLQETAFERQDHTLENALDLLRVLQHELMFILDPENEWNPENIVYGIWPEQWDEHSVRQVEVAIEICEGRETMDDELLAPVINGNIPQFK